jgi:hypothetical protein
MIIAEYAGILTVKEAAVSINDHLGRPGGNQCGF